MPNQGRLFCILAALFWSLSGLFTKSLALPAMVMATARVLFAGLALLPFLRGRRRSWRPALVGMVACFAAMNLTFVTAMTVTTAANAIFLQYTAPLWMLAVSVLWFREPFDPRNTVPLGLGMLGIAVIILGGGAGDALGISLGLAAGAAYGGVALFLRYLRDEDSIFLTVLNHLGSGLLLLPLVINRHAETLHALSPKTWTLLALFGVVQMAIPYVFFSRGLREVTTTEAGIITLIEPVLNPIWTYCFVGESPSLTTLVGGGVILGGVAWRYLPRRAQTAI
jgi:drug/metabolite transporter (DMT)-like permease